VSARSGGSTTIKHREFVIDVAGSIAFTATPFPINAGRDTLFCWLSELAAQYEKYQFQNLRFIYEPRCPTSIAGSIILAVDFDALDAAPTTKQNVYSYHHCSQSSAWDENCYHVDSAILRSRGPLFTRTGAAPANSDLKTYDLGNLFLCTSGFAGTDVVGELFAEYEVLLLTPQTAVNTQGAYNTANLALAAGALFGSPVATGGLLDRTYSSASTVTLNQNWMGVVTCLITGTGLASGGFTTSGTCVLVLVSESWNAAGTSGVLCFRISGAQGIRGSTIIPGITATTVTGCQMYWGNYSS
jgi:hypothetical protein